MTDGIFITGTDTGVGKTTVSCALLRKYVAAGDAILNAVPTRAALHSGSWFYDGPRRNLHILIGARANLDHIVNIMF